MKKYAYIVAGGLLMAAGSFVSVAPVQAASVDFSIRLGNVVIGYEDGYYDRDRRWHKWRNNSERNWYRQYRRDSYFAMRRDRDRDRFRRDWWEGRRSDWRSGGPDFTIQLGNIVFAYEDGYYDNNRRWHAWRNNQERDWYRRNNARTYYEYRRDRERDQRRRDWIERRRDNWQF